MSVDPQSLSLTEFLAWEQRQTTKYEFRDGDVAAMAGASDDHNQIVTNAIALLRPKLRGSNCRIYANDMKLLTEFPSARYPDILVTCDLRDAEDRLVKRHPKLIAEVLSANTAQIDTAEKLDEYQTIPELEEYVLIDSRRRSIRIYRRKGALFETAPVYTSGHVEFASLAITLAIDEIYEDVSFE